MAKKMHAGSHKPPRVKPRGAREAASEAVDEMLSKTEQKRHAEEMAARRRQTLDELEQDARNLAEYARDKMEHMGQVIRETAEATREATGLPSLGGEKESETATEAVKQSLQAASDKLSEELGDMSQRVESVKARVAESMQAAGGRAADTWHQSSEAATNVGEREYCLPLPTHRLCARHVVFVTLPLVILCVLWLLRRRYPKKWEAGMEKVKNPRVMMAREPPSTHEKLQAQVKDVADSVTGSMEEKTAYAKRQGLGMFDETKRKATAAAEKAKRDAEAAMGEFEAKKKK